MEMIRSESKLLPVRGIVLVTMTSLNPALERRSTAGPENTACVAAK